jgi:hypothetical protein
MPAPNIEIFVRRVNWRRLGEDPHSDAEYEFSATLQNLAGLSMNDAKVRVSCNYPVTVKDRHADFVPDGTLEKEASFRVKCPMHPKEPPRQMSLCVTAPAYLQFAEAKPPTIKIAFDIYATDNEPITLVTDSDHMDTQGKPKQALPPR